MLVNGLLMTNGIPTFDTNKPEKSLIAIANKVNIPIKKTIKVSFNARYMLIDLIYTKIYLSLFEYTCM